MLLVFRAYYRSALHRIHANPNPRPCQRKRLFPGDQGHPRDRMAMAENGVVRER